MSLEKRRRGEGPGSEQRRGGGGGRWPWEAGRRGCGSAAAGSGCTERLGAELVPGSAAPFITADREHDARRDGHRVYTASSWGSVTKRYFIDAYVQGTFKRDYRTENLYAAFR